MNAIVGYSDETVEEAQAAIEAKKPRSERKAKGPPDVEKPLPKQAVNDLGALLAQAKAAQQERTE